MALVEEQTADGRLRLGEITSAQDLETNVRMNAIPDSIRAATAESYSAFLKERRFRMAQVIKDYYFAL